MTRHFVSQNARRIAVAALASLSGAALLHPSTAAAETELASGRMTYVLFSPGSESLSMSGSMDDVRLARSLRTGDEAMLYVRKDGATYVIRDSATLAKAREIFKPQEEMGARQAELGSRQAELGARQARLGAEQARIGLLQAEAGSREQAELGRQQGELGRQQGELGEQQGELGRQQGELGRQQARLGRVAQEQLRALVADAIGRGVAQRVN
jgi:hypothetical protein